MDAYSVENPVNPTAVFEAEPALMAGRADDPAMLELERRLEWPWAVLESFRLVIDALSLCQTALSVFCMEGH
jgi:hypothetical protein